MQPSSNEEILRDYNLSGLAPGWYFKRFIDASGQHHIEGACLDGQTYSMSGDDPDGILKECVLQAGRWGGSVDLLTGLSNRKMFKNDLTVLLQNNTGIHLPISVIYMDLDNFMLINDQLGHLVGDQILSRVGNVLNTINNMCGVRFYRVGGDEFTAILTHADEIGIQKIIQGIHNKMDSLELEDGQKINNKNVTLTGGVSTTLDANISSDKLIDLAYEGLYRNKRDNKGKITNGSQSIDPLTGLFNRAVFNSDLSYFLQNNTEYYLPLSVIYMDIDHFKEANDQLGHLVGDQVLARIGNMLTTLGARHDVNFYRVGCDEFTVILTRADETSAQHFIQAIYKCMDSLQLENDLTIKNKPYTITAGMVTTTDGNTTAEELVTLADKDLYQCALLKTKAVNFLRLSDCVNIF